MNLQDNGVTRGIVRSLLETKDAGVGVTGMQSVQIATNGALGTLAKTHLQLVLEEMLQWLEDNENAEAGGTAQILQAFWQILWNYNATRDPHQLPILDQKLTQSMTQYMVREISVVGPRDDRLEGMSGILVELASVHPSVVLPSLLSIMDCNLAPDAGDVNLQRILDTFNNISVQDPIILKDRFQEILSRLLPLLQTGQTDLKISLCSTFAALSVAQVACMHISSGRPVESASKDTRGDPLMVSTRAGSPLSTTFNSGASDIGSAVPTPRSQKPNSSYSAEIKDLIASREDPTFFIRYAKLSLPYLHKVQEKKLQSAWENVLQILVSAISRSRDPRLRNHVMDAVGHVIFLVSKDKLGSLASELMEWYLAIGKLQGHKIPQEGRPPRVQIPSDQYLRGLGLYLFASVHSSTQTRQLVEDAHPKLVQTLIQYVSLLGPLSFLLGQSTTELAHRLTQTLQCLEILAKEFVQQIFPCIAEKFGTAFAKKDEGADGGLFNFLPGSRKLGPEVGHEPDNRLSLLLILRHLVQNLPWTSFSYTDRLAILLILARVIRDTKDTTSLSRHIPAIDDMVNLDSDTNLQTLLAEMIAALGGFFNVACYPDDYVKDNPRIIDVDDRKAMRNNVALAHDCTMLLINWLTEQASIANAEIAKGDATRARRDEEREMGSNIPQEEVQYDDPEIGAALKAIESVKATLGDVKERCGLVLRQLASEADVSKSRWTRELLWPLLLKGAVNVKMLPALPVLSQALRHLIGNVSDDLSELEVVFSEPNRKDSDHSYSATPHDDAKAHGQESNNRMAGTIDPVGVFSWLLLALHDPFCTPGNGRAILELLRALSKLIHPQLAEIWEFQRFANAMKRSEKDAETLTDIVVTHENRGQENRVSIRGALSYDRLAILGAYLQFERQSSKFSFDAWFRALAHELDFFLSAIGKDGDPFAGRLLDSLLRMKLKLDGFEQRIFQAATGIADRPYPQYFAMNPNVPQPTLSHFSLPMRAGFYSIVGIAMAHSLNYPRVFGVLEILCSPNFSANLPGRPIAPGQATVAPAGAGAPHHHQGGNQNRGGANQNQQAGGQGANSTGMNAFMQLGMQFAAATGAVQQENPNPNQQPPSILSPHANSYFWSHESMVRRGCAAGLGHVACQHFEHVLMTITRAVEQYRSETGWNDPTAAKEAVARVQQADNKGFLNNLFGQNPQLEQLKIDQDMSMRSTLYLALGLSALHAPSKRRLLDHVGPFMLRPLQESLELEVDILEEKEKAEAAKQAREQVAGAPVKTFVYAPSIGDLLVFISTISSIRCCADAIVWEDLELHPLRDPFIALSTWAIVDEGAAKVAEMAFHHGFGAGVNHGGKNAGPGGKSAMKNQSDAQSSAHATSLNTSPMASSPVIGSPVGGACGAAVEDLRGWNAAEPDVDDPLISKAEQRHFNHYWPSNAGALQHAATLHIASDVLIKRADDLEKSQRAEATYVAARTGAAKEIAKGKSARKNETIGGAVSSTAEAFTYDLDNTGFASGRNSDNFPINYTEFMKEFRNLQQQQEKQIHSDEKLDGVIRHHRDGILSLLLSCFNMGDDPTHGEEKRKRRKKRRKEPGESSEPVVDSNMFRKFEPVCCLILDCISRLVALPLDLEQDLYNGILDTALHVLLNSVPQNLMDSSEVIGGRLVTKSSANKIAAVPRNDLDQSTNVVATVPNVPGQPLPAAQNGGVATDGIESATMSGEDNPTPRPARSSTVSSSGGYEVSEDLWQRIISVTDVLKPLLFRVHHWRGMIELIQAVSMFDSDKEFLRWLSTHFVRVLCLHAPPLHVSPEFRDSQVSVITSLTKLINEAENSATPRQGDGLPGRRQSPARGREPTTPSTDGDIESSIFESQHFEGRFHLLNAASISTRVGLGTSDLSDTNDEVHDWCRCLAFLLPRLADSCESIALTALDAVQHLLLRCEWTHHTFIFSKKGIHGSAEDVAISRPIEDVFMLSHQPYDREEKIKKAALKWEGVRQNHSRVNLVAEYLATDATLSPDEKREQPNTGNTVDSFNMPESELLCELRQDYLKSKNDTQDVPTRQLASIIVKHLPWHVIPAFIIPLIKSMHDSDNQSANAVVDALSFTLERVSSKIGKMPAGFSDKSKAEQETEEFSRMMAKPFYVSVDKALAKLDERQLYRVLTRGGTASVGSNAVNAPSTQDVSVSSPSRRQHQETSRPNDVVRAIINRILHEVEKVSNLDIQKRVLNCLKILCKDHFTLLMTDLMRYGPDFSSSQASLIQLLSKDEDLLQKMLTLLPSLILNCSGILDGVEDGDKLVAGAVVALGHVLNNKDTGIRKVTESRVPELFTILLLRFGEISYAVASVKSRRFERELQSKKKDTDGIDDGDMSPNQVAQALDTAQTVHDPALLRRQLETVWCLTNLISGRKESDPLCDALHTLQKRLKASLKTNSHSQVSERAAASSILKSGKKPRVKASFSKTSMTEEIDEDSFLGMTSATAGSPAYFYYVDEPISELVAFFALSRPALQSKMVAFLFHHGSKLGCENPVAYEILKGKMGICEPNSNTPRTPVSPTHGDCSRGAPGHKVAAMTILGQLVANIDSDEQMGGKTDLRLLPVLDFVKCCSRTCLDTMMDATSNRLVRTLAARAVSQIYLFWKTRLEAPINSSLPTAVVANADEPVPLQLFEYLFAGETCRFEEQDVQRLQQSLAKINDPSLLIETSESISYALDLVVIASEKLQQCAHIVNGDSQGPNRALAPNQTLGDQDLSADAMANLIMESRGETVAENEQNSGEALQSLKGYRQVVVRWSTALLQLLGDVHILLERSDPAIRRCGLELIGRLCLLFSTCCTYPEIDRVKMTYYMSLIQRLSVLVVIRLEDSVPAVKEAATVSFKNVLTAIVPGRPFAKEQVIQYLQCENRFEAFVFPFFRTLYQQSNGEQALDDNIRASAAQMDAFSDLFGGKGPSSDTVTRKDSNVTKKKSVFDDIFAPGNAFGGLDDIFGDKKAKAEEVMIRPSPASPASLPKTTPSPQANGIVSRGKSVVLQSTHQMQAPRQATPKDHHTQETSPRKSPSLKAGQQQSQQSNQQDMRGNGRTNSKSAELTLFFQNPDPSTPLWLFHLKFCRTHLSWVESAAGAGFCATAIIHAVKEEFPMNEVEKTQFNEEVATTCSAILKLLRDTRKPSLKTKLAQILQHLG